MENKETNEEDEKEQEEIKTSEIDPYGFFNFGIEDVFDPTGFW